MDEKAVQLFIQRKRNALPHDKHAQYQQAIKEYREMKYGASFGGKTVEREITQDRIDKAAAKKKLVADPAEDLLKFIDIKVV